MLLLQDQNGPDVGYRVEPTSSFSKGRDAELAPGRQGTATPTLVPRKIQKAHAEPGPRLFSVLEAWAEERRGELVGFCGGSVGTVGHQHSTCFR